MMVENDCNKWWQWTTMANYDGEWWRWMLMPENNDFNMTMVIAFEIGDSDADEDGNSNSS